MRWGSRRSRNRWKEEDWHLWFAWRPVFCKTEDDYGQWCWLENVRRKKIVDEYSYGNIWYYEYKAIQY